MAYVAVTGGQEAIAQANLLADWLRWQRGEPRIALPAVEVELRALVHKVMSEGGLYAPAYAALALKQAQGDPLEAAFLLRAYRSTLPRHHYSHGLDVTAMRVVRRISSAFKDIPGGQMLGATRDYSHRLLDFGLRDEPAGKGSELSAALAAAAGDETADGAGESGGAPGSWPQAPKVADLLREQGLLSPVGDGLPAKPYDITRETITFPVPRSGQLQVLARGETGAMMALAYSSMRGFGTVHPTICELRVGHVGLSVKHPLRPTAEPLYAGELLVTEAETINSFTRSSTTGKTDIQFELGYGLCFGQNEIKAISMAILERSISGGGPAPAQDEEFVLSHIDGVEASGFISHLKLPHYVTFQAALSRIRQARSNRSSGQGVE